MTFPFARVVALLAVVLVSHAALAHAWPNRPVGFVVPSAAGAGAGGIAGTEVAAKAAAPGATFLMTDVSLVMSACLS
jgi:tripartite-type tricarboxylate transporter receptor subunit TctC